LHHGVVRGINVVIQRGLNLLHLEGREKTVIDALLERVYEHRVAEVGVGINIVFALGGGGESELHGGGEVFQDSTPVAFAVGAAAMALVNDDEIEEVGRIFT